MQTDRHNKSDIQTSDRESELMPLQLGWMPGSRHWERGREGGRDGVAAQNGRDGAIQFR